jgi:hypothetical protein
LTASSKSTLVSAISARVDFDRAATTQPFELPWSQSRAAVFACESVDKCAIRRAQASRDANASDGPGLSSTSPGKSAALITKQLGFQQTTGQRAAINFTNDSPDRFDFE